MAEQQRARILRLHPQDNVLVAIDDLAAGQWLPEFGLAAAEAVPAGHKLAAADIRAGQQVKKYGQTIGVAACDIAAGRHVHTHNLSAGELAQEYQFGAAVDTAAKSAAGDLFFDGIRRADGRIATRNYIGVLSTVNCSASVVRMIADAFRGPALEDYPRVDGVVPVCHGWGCGMAGSGEAFEYLRDALAGWAAHPNFAAVLVVGLGCEVMQPEVLGGLPSLAEGSRVKLLNIQQAGGTAATVAAGVEMVASLLPEADRAVREAVPVEHLVVALECGGSDAYSGITANPALGAAADLLVDHGATVVLGETPEIYGAEHLLTRRAVRREVGEKLIERIRWWEAYTAAHGAALDNNPSPGNKAGGLTTIFEKSLGAVAKGGSRPLAGVYRYARPITERGLVFMDTPGYDPVSLTGMVAGGANLICFTTGRGSVYGCRPVPSLKLATNTPMFRRMAGDMDLDCGIILDGEVGVAQMGRRIFEAVIETASGRRTKSEALGFGDLEFVPWQVGAVL